MKRLVIILMAVFTLGSCSINDDNRPNIEYELAEITENDLPDSFEFGKSYTVTVTYQLPSQCSTFSTIDARRAGGAGEARRQIYVAAISSIGTNSNCNDDVAGNSGTSTFFIVIDEMEDYKFYFWTGFNAADEPIYNEVTVPVEEAG